MASATRAAGTSCYSCWWLDSNSYPVEPDFLKKVITGDELWVYGYDPETKALLSQNQKLPGSPRLKTTQQSRNKTKTMLTVFFDWEGVVHLKYAPPGLTINKEYYLNVLCQWRDAIWQKWAQLWATGDWQLHHDNMTTVMHHILCRVFWRNIKSPRWLSPPTAQIWHPATSGFS